MASSVDPAPALYQPVPANRQSEKLPYKSFRKKYRKLKLTFDEKMRESNLLHKQEAQLKAVAERLQEENDQLLDLLLEYQDTQQIPQGLTYDIAIDSSVAIPEPPPDLEGLDSDKVFEGLVDDRILETEKRITHEEFMSNVARADSVLERLPPRSLAQLEMSTTHSNTRHVPPQDTLKPEKGANEHAFLTPDHEEQYLAAMDKYIEAGNADARGADRPGRTGQKVQPTDNEIAKANPVSVYQWLKKHRPEVFHEDNASERSTVKPASRSKRASLAAPAASKGDADMDEDDVGFAEPPTQKGKRSREDDGAYRPKGGHSRPGKRKREDGDTTKGSKKKAPRTSLSHDKAAR